MAKLEFGYFEELFKRNTARNHRSIAVLVGLQTKQYIPVLHSRLTGISPLQHIVWCFKNAETAADSVAKKEKASDTDGSVAKWNKANEPEHLAYKDCGRMLGRTCDMLILQDFEALSPNLAVTCIETVRGGGLVVLLLDQEKSLKELLGREMDIHAGLGEGVEQRFNRRFFRSLLQSECTVIFDHKLRITAVGRNDSTAEAIDPTPARAEDGFNETKGVLSLCCTADQRQAVLSCCEFIDNSMKAVVSVTAPRGRGKSAALGLSVAYAIHMGVSSVLVSALFLDNIQTLLEYTVKGLQTLGYAKVTDFKIAYDFTSRKRMISSIHFGRTKQSIEYIHPFTAPGASPGLLVIDEAASIPLGSADGSPGYVERMLGTGLVFMASTLGGYEGTGRAYSNKLITRIQQTGRTLRQVELWEPIRYAANDPVEAWLNRALLLDTKPRALKESPPPSACCLFHVHKHNLFSGAAEAEKVLAELFAVFAASHYRNSPNDIQILADAPNHEVFVLLTPGGRIIAAAQIAFEGRINPQSTKKEGNLIPWLMLDIFNYKEFGGLLGARLVRIAVHPSAYSMGYGSVLLQGLKNAFNSGECTTGPTLTTKNSAVIYNTVDSIKIPKTEWIGASFGLSERLLAFWKRNGFTPIGIKQETSQSTGEHSVVVLAGIGQDKIAELHSLFTTRFISLLSFGFRGLSPSLALAIIHAQPRHSRLRVVEFTDDEMERLKRFAGGVISPAHVMDALPRVAEYFFLGEDIYKISVLHQSVLLMVGGQRRKIAEAARTLSLEEFQIGMVLSKAVEDILFN